MPVRIQFKKSILTFAGVVMDLATPPTFAQQIIEGFSAVATGWRVKVRRLESWESAQGDYLLTARRIGYGYQHRIPADVLTAMVLTPIELGKLLGTQCNEQYRQVLALSRAGTKARQTRSEP